MNHKKTQNTNEIISRTIRSNENNSPHLYHVSNFSHCSRKSRRIKWKILAQFRLTNAFLHFGIRMRPLRLRYVARQ